jgi:hypothetical protein
MMLHQSVTLLALMLLICHPADSQFQRQVFSEKGGSIDTPEPHPLGFFVEEPFLRDDADELCSDCSLTGKANTADRFAIRPAVRQIGELAAFRIVEVLYCVAPKGSSLEHVKWKSILVQRAPDQYAEIFHLGFLHCKLACFVSNYTFRLRTSTRH